MHETTKKMLEHIRKQVVKFTLKEGSAFIGASLVLGPGEVQNVPFEFANYAEKRRVIAMLRILCEQIKPALTIVTTEMWMVQSDSLDRSELPDDLSECEDKIETLSVLIEAPGGDELIKLYRIIRDDQKKIVELIDMHREGFEAIDCNLRILNYKNKGPAH